MVIRATGASVSVPQPRCAARSTASCRGSERAIRRASAAPPVGWRSRRESHLPEGGVGDLVGAVSTCVSVTTRSAARPRPPVTAERQPLHAPGPAGTNHSVSRSWKTNSPLLSRPAYPLSIARESPESGDDLSPAWQQASIRREGSHGHQGRARRSKGDTRDVTNLRRRQARRRAR